MINLRKYISRSPRIVSEKYLDDISANSSSSIYLDYGFNGFEVLSEGETTSGNSEYYAIKALDSSSVSTTTNFGDPLASISIIVTDVIFGNFTSITCESGKIIAYIK
jgi:hypothetical protein